LPCLGGEGLSPRELGLAKRSALVREDFPTAGVTVPVMRVKGEEPLGPDLRGLEPINQ
jgi:hypothetical protein